MAETGAIIEQGTVIKGSLSGGGSVVVRGRVEGHVALKDKLTIENAGKVFADVEVETLAIYGELSGDINAGNRVTIAASAKVVGDITAPHIVIEDGARFKGSITMNFKLPEGI